MARVKHYVNLHRNALFVERGIDSIDRMGPGVFFKAKFKNPDALPVTFRTVLVSETSPYTDAEKNRNMWYRLQEPIGLDVNEGDEMEANSAALLPPSGGAVYKIQARAGDKTVDTTDELETWRRLFFQIFYMKDATHTITVPNLQPTIDYYKTLFVEFLDQPAGAKADIPFLEYALSEDLFRLVKPKYTVRDREPWVLALVFSNALPQLVEIKIGAKPYLGNVALPSRLSGNDELVYELPEGKYAWFGLNPGHDAANGGKGSWLRSDGIISVDGKNVVIPKNDIVLDTTHSYRNGHGFNRLKIRLPESARNQNIIFSKDAKLTVTLWVLNGFSGGFARRDENMLTVGGRSWWNPSEDTPDEKLQVLNHELGHKLGMVPKGGRLLGAQNELDAPDKLYGDIDEIYEPQNPSVALKNQIAAGNNAKGHRGAHCERGASATQKDATWKWSGTPECTMFGATGTRSARTPQKFCSVCAKLVIRQNLDPADPAAAVSFKSPF
jgi:hypothetical protein